MADELGRLNAEQAVLGAMLMDPGCAASVLPRLREDDFSVEHNRVVFRAVQGAQLAGNERTRAAPERQEKPLKSVRIEIIDGEEVAVCE